RPTPIANSTGLEGALREIRLETITTKIGVPPFKSPVRAELTGCSATGNTDKGNGNQATSSASIGPHSVRSTGRRDPGNIPSATNPSAMRAKVTPSGGRISSPFAMNRNDAPQISPGTKVRATSFFSPMPEGMPARLFRMPELFFKVSLSHTERTMIDFNRLRCLHAVATHGSVTPAAAELHLSASAVSQQLSKLDEELGHRLLEPRGPGIRLPEPALVLAGHAPAVLAQLWRARADLEATQTAVHGSLRLGVFPTAARGIAPGALARLRREHARLEVEMQELEPTDSIGMLLRGDLDLVVAQDWFNSPLVLPRDVERRELLDDQADLVVPADHRLAKRRSVELAELVAEKWISWQQGSNCYDWLVLTLRMSG